MGQEQSSNTSPVRRGSLVRKNSHPPTKSPKVGDRRPPHEQAPSRDDRRPSYEHPPSRGERRLSQEQPRPATQYNQEPQKQPDNPGFMASFRAAVGSRTLEDVCSLDKSSKPLGKGTFGTVYRGRLRSNGVVVAVKMIEKNKLKMMKVSTTLVINECDMMRECVGKDNCLQLYDFLETSNTFYLFLEFCDGGNVQDGTMAVEGQLGESHVRFLMHQMMESIVFLHSRNICHRDIKPHNYLVAGRIASSSVKIKLGDFGTAVRLERGKLLKEQVGTPAFMAPELHLLPDKSNGYDHKVDVWAIGVCMIFLLANEYPFIDGKGRLLRQKIIEGDVPLWEGNSFQNLFQGAQEFLGMARKRPSARARNLVRHLLAPRRQDRTSSFQALKHEWFTTPITEATFEDFGDNLPLLDMKEFDNAFSIMTREFGGALDALGKVQIAAVIPHLPQQYDPNDERIQKCVVCFHDSGEYRYVCPQCTHAVCIHCLEKLKTPICPHCRHDAIDLAVTQNIAHFARRGSKLVDDATALAHMPVNVPIAFQVSGHGHTLEERARRNMCFCCSAPSSANNYICPSCNSSICFECAKNVLVATPRCPCCGDIDHVAATVPQYIAANEAWQSAAQFTDAISRSISDMTAHFAGTPATPTHGHGHGHSHGHSAQPMLTKIPSEPIGHGSSGTCVLCTGIASMFDHVCPICRAATCGACISTRLREPYCCPCCHDSSRNASSMQIIASAHHARKSWGNFWGSVVDSLGGQHQSIPTQSRDRLTTV